MNREILREADFSDDRKYRYRLYRSIPQVVRWIKPCLFIMLNPSTADESKDDPTIRRCVSFANRELCTSLTVVNLFSLRATNPKELSIADDPEGEFRLGRPNADDVRVIGDETTPDGQPETRKSSDGPGSLTAPRMRSRGPIRTATWRGL